MGLRKIILHEPVSKLELRELLTLKPNDTVKAAVKLMRTKRLGCVVIIDEQGKPLGEFTEHSLLKLLLVNPEAMSCDLKDVMGDDWTTVKLTDPVAKVLDAMHDGSRFVVVVDEDGKAIHLTGQKGLMEYIADHFPRQVKVHMIDDVKLFQDQREGA